MSGSGAGGCAVVKEVPVIGSVEREKKGWTGREWELS